MTAKPGPGTVSAESVRQELERILASKQFIGSDRLSRFLRFAVERTLAEQSGTDQPTGLKEYIIATEVYEKDQSFDPRMDPIVRVEARRLRDRLKEYYEGEGSGNPVRIELPKGAYAPVFQTSHKSALGAAP